VRPVFRAASFEEVARRPKPPETTFEFAVAELRRRMVEVLGISAEYFGVDCAVTNGERNINVFVKPVCPAEFITITCQVAPTTNKGE